MSKSTAIAAVSLLIASFADAAPPTLAEILESNEAYRQALGTIAYEVESTTTLYNPDGNVSGCNIRRGSVVASGFCFKSRTTVAACDAAEIVVGPVDVASGPRAIIVRRGARAGVDVFPLTDEETPETLNELQASLAVFVADVHTLGFRLPSAGQMVPFEGTTLSLAADVFGKTSPGGGWTATVDQSENGDCMVRIDHARGRSTSVTFRTVGGYWVPISLEARNPVGFPSWRQTQEFGILDQGSAGGVPALLGVEFESARPAAPGSLDAVVISHVRTRVLSAHAADPLGPSAFDPSAYLAPGEKESSIRIRSGRDATSQRD